MGEMIFVDVFERVFVGVVGTWDFGRPVLFIYFVALLIYPSIDIYISNIYIITAAVLYGDREATTRRQTQHW